MILKILKTRKEENSTETKIINEYYEDKWFRLCDGFIESNKDNIYIEKYNIRDEITGDWIEYETIEAYLMNNEGKTIEKIK